MVSRKLFLIIAFIGCIEVGYAVKSIDRYESEATLEAPSSLGYKFKDPWLQKKALQPRTPAFEQLEFLGDRVLGLATAHFLYRCYPASLAALSKTFARLVSKESLAQAYKALALDPGCLASPYYHPSLSGAIADKTASDIVEALLGAIALDGGMEEAFRAHKQLLSYMPALIPPPRQDTHDLLRLLAQRTEKCTRFPPRHLNQLQNILGYQFREKQLLVEAFHHASSGGTLSKALHFMGVHVLNMVMAYQVWSEDVEAPEGILSRSFAELTSSKKVEEVFQIWQLWQYVDYEGSLGMRLTASLPPRMQTETVHALVGAIYLDRGWEEARTLTTKLFFEKPRPSELVKKPLEYLTESTQSRPPDISPRIRSQSSFDTGSVDWPSLASLAFSVPFPSVGELCLDVRSKQTKSYASIAAAPSTGIQPSSKVSQREAWPALKKAPSKRS